MINVITQKVADIMRIGDRGWDDDIVRDLFNSRDQTCIRKITLADNTSDDSLYWCKENTGEYSVKSAYRLLQSQKGRWQTEDNNSLWRTVWKIKAPPKVLNMVWRALAQCLPTLTALHAQCWGDKGLLWVESSFGSFAEWLDEVLRLSRKDEYAEIVTLCWSI
nr:PREDICTED: uncharacterized protein LOC108226775 [Daucus carota subsp. sativus]